MRTIVLITRDEDACELLPRLIRRVLPDADCVAFRSAEEALKALGSKGVSVAVVADGLDETGPKTVDRLRDVQPTLPVILVAVGGRISPEAASSRATRVVAWNNSMDIVEAVKSVL